MADIVAPVPPAQKAPWQSKTLWMALVVAVAGFFPAAQEFIAKSPEMVGIIMGAVFGLLRLISKDKIIID